MTILNLFGPDSSHIGNETLKMLGQLMAHLLYHEVDRAAAILLRLDTDDKQNLAKIGFKLSELCEVCIKDDTL